MTDVIVPGSLSHYLGRVPLQIREGCTNENPEKVWSFAKGGGVSEGSKMPNLYFGKVFFS